MNLFIWKWLKSKTFHLNKKMVKNLVMNSIFPSIFNIFIIWKWRKRPGCSYIMLHNFLLKPVPFKVCASRPGYWGRWVFNSGFYATEKHLGLLRSLWLGHPNRRQSWAQAFGGGCGFSPATARSWGEDHAMRFVTLAAQRLCEIKMAFP